MIRINSCFIKGFGNFAAPLCAVFLLLATSDLDVVWRLCFGLGALPGIIVLPFRIMMHETESFKKAAKKEKKDNFFKRTWQRGVLISKHWRNIIGTAGNW